MHLYLHIGSGEVFHLPRLDLAFLDGLHDGVLQGLRGLREGDLANHKCLLVDFFDLRTYLQHATALSVVVFRHVDAARCGEVGKELERLFVEIGNGGIADLAEVMGEDF